MTKCPIVPRRFVVQHNNYSCGPIALINANIWKYGRSQRSFREYLNLCRTNPDEYGTDRHNLYIDDLATTKQPILDMKKIERAVDQGNGAIILYSYLNDDSNEIKAHYIFVIKNENKIIAFNSVNTGYKCRHSIYPQWNDFVKDLLNECKSDKHGEYPCGWIINKN